MKNLKKLYNLLMSDLPKPIRTKINKSELDRGGKGVFTKRRKRSDLVLIPFISFKENWDYNIELINSTYLKGFRVLCTPSEYFLNLNLLANTPVLVRYQHYKELEDFPLPINEKDIKSNRKEYSENEIIFVIDIKNLDKFANSGVSKYVGPEKVGQHEMDYATEDEILKVKMCLLFQVINCYDFKDVMVNNKLLPKYIEYAEKFVTTELYLENPSLQNYTTNYGFTVCPELIKFPNKNIAKISCLDIINGKIDGDVGRETFNRTTTKVNLHHESRLISGKLNHNHKNVFLGSEAGNTINAAIFRLGKNISDLFFN